jgi:hypothetical protein
MSKFNVAKYVKEHEQEGKENGYLLFNAPGIPSKKMEDILKIRLNNLS